MTRRLVLVILLVAACSKTSAPTTPEPSGPVVTLRDLQNGDRACYVVVETADGQEQSIEGDFDLCNAEKEALIGKKVTYTTKKANVLAASCEGDVDCGKSDEVDLVITITEVP